MRRNKGFLWMALFAVMLGACASNERTPGAVTFESPTPAPASTSGSDTMIFAFKAPKLGGGQVDGGDLQGQDVAIWFWAPW